MSFAAKIAENKKVAEMCMKIGAYNAGASRAYYSAFLHIKSFLKGKEFDYIKFLKQINSDDKLYSHGTIQSAVVTCLMAKGKKPVDVYKLNCIDSMYDKRRRADYDRESIIEAELKTSLENLDTVLSIVA
jgi:uncharacterized protein (UPF0332 family)